MLTMENSSLLLRRLLFDECSRSPAVPCVNMESNLNFKSNTLQLLSVFVIYNLGAKEGDIQCFKLVLVSTPPDKWGNERAKILQQLTQDLPIGFDIKHEYELKHKSVEGDIHYK